MFKRNVNIIGFVLSILFILFACTESNITAPEDSAQEQTFESQSTVAVPPDEYQEDLWGNTSSYQDEESDPSPPLSPREVVDVK